MNLGLTLVGESLERTRQRYYYKPWNEPIFDSNQDFASENKIDPWLDSGNQVNNSDPAQKFVHVLA